MVRSLLWVELSKGLTAMNDKLSDYDLGHDSGAQLDLISRAYSSQSQQKIDAALARVVSVRRMRRNGILDWERMPKGEE